MLSPHRNQLSGLLRKSSNWFMHEIGKSVSYQVFKTSLLKSEIYKTDSQGLV